MSIEVNDREMADGVPVDKLYPIDIKRAPASLDKIKPHVSKWWGNESELLQIMCDGVADIARAFHTRADKHPAAE